MYHATHLFPKKGCSIVNNNAGRSAFCCSCTMPHICSKNLKVQQSTTLQCYSCTMPHIIILRRSFNRQQHCRPRFCHSCTVPHTYSEPKGLNRKQQCRPNKRNAAAHTCAANNLGTRFATTQPLTALSYRPTGRERRCLFPVICPATMGGRLGPACP